MASAESSGHVPDRTVEHERKASPTGAYVATAGVVIFLISMWLDWVTTDDDTSGSGYETDTVIPLLAYLGIGLVVALFYALSRARGRQHRGLTLVTMAVGIAAVLVSLSYLLDAPGAFERTGDLDTEIGAWVGLLGGIVWSIGAGLLAKEPEGDDDWHGARVATDTRAAASSPGAARPLGPAGCLWTHGCPGFGALSLDRCSRSCGRC